MPIIGSSKLSAINEILASVDNLPVVDLDTGGSSDAAMAERFLDYETMRIQMMGTDDNMDKCRPFTADGSGQIGIEADWLAVQGAGPNADDRYFLRGSTYLWNGRSHSTTITTSGATVFLDVIRQVTWDDCSPRLKNSILSSAIQKFQRRMKGDPQADLQLQGENAQALLISEKDTSQNPSLVRFPIPRPQGNPQANQ